MISKNDILNRWSKNGGKDYTHYDSVHKDFNSPNKIIPELIKYFSPKSVIDVGCDLGAWIKVFEKNGVKDYLGVEHIEFNKERLLISKDKVQLLDLGNQDTYPINIGRKFDIAMCLEVAEHLPVKISEKFVSFLSHLSDVNLSSSAIPHQGGINHINE